MEKATFIISLDFELHWGRFDKVELERNVGYYLNTRKAIPQILALFDKYHIEATWATVGMLFAENWEEWSYYQPALLPSYRNRQLSAYQWANQFPQADTRCLFAPDLIQMLTQYPGQEIGSHTFAHYYTMEEGQGDEAFRADLRAAQHIAHEKFGLSLSSLVFPRNQYNSEYRKICMEEGFKVIRSNPGDWFWKDTQQEHLVKRIFRTGDAFIRLGSRTSYGLRDIPKEIGLPLSLPASRMYRLYPKYDFFSSRRVNRIKEELGQAARKGEVYHLWWHPHNFGDDLSKNLICLEKILKHFDRLRDEFGMKSMNMGSLYNSVERPALKESVPFQKLQIKVG